MDDRSKIPIEPHSVQGERGIDPTQPPAEPVLFPVGIRLDEQHPETSQCSRCDTCDGFPCLVHAKADAHTTCVLPAMATGKLLGNSSGLVGRNYMCHLNSAVVSVGKKVNPTKFQKTFGVNDFYFGAPGFEYPLGHIQMLGKMSKEMLAEGAPFFAPGLALDFIAKHSIDWWLTSEDLPSPDNRVTVDESGGITLHYTPNNEEGHKRLPSGLMTPSWTVIAVLLFARDYLEHSGVLVDERALVILVRDDTLAPRWTHGVEVEPWQEHALVGAKGEGTERSQSDAVVVVHGDRIRVGRLVRSVGHGASRRPSTCEVPGKGRRPEREGVHGTSHRHHEHDSERDCQQGHVRSLRPRRGTARRRRAVLRGADVAGTQN